MDELARKVDDARGQVVVDWSEERARVVRRGVARRQRQRAIGRATAMLSAAAATAAVAFWLHGAPTVLPALPVIDRGLHLADGSTATPLDPDTRLVTRAAGPDRVEVRLERGRARFSVVHDPRRLFRVEVGAVAVEDMGTEFTVARMGEKVRVQVAVGRVRVIWGNGQTELAAGADGQFPPPPQSDDIGSDESPATGSPPTTRPAKVTPTRARWKTLADEGDFDAAYSEMTRPGAPTFHDQPDELLAAADVARLSHHPADAVEPLRRLVRDHARDPRAPLGAFTLGRVLLEELGRPREAADAFVEVARLGPDGPLAPDALAREVEAWSRAGEVGRARARAEEYLRRFPNGSRVRSVHRYGGLE